MKIRTLAAAAALAITLGLSACSAEFSPVGIFAICSAPAPDAVNGSCLYPATCDTVFAGTPVLDATVAEVDFRLPVQINNLLTDNSSAADGRINTNDAYIQSFEMTYAGASLQPWTVAASITVPTAGSSGAVLRLIPVEYFPALVPPGASTLSILVNVRAHGVLASQSSFTTAWFQVPVSVCAGCLASSFTCATGSVLASCPSAKRFGAAPGQTANLACATLQ
jgi:hypothetical protein